MNLMQQFAHGGVHILHRCFAIDSQMYEKTLHIRIMHFGTALALTIFRGKFTIWLDFYSV